MIVNQVGDWVGYTIYSMSDEIGSHYTLMMKKLTMRHGAIRSKEVSFVSIRKVSEELAEAVSLSIRWQTFNFLALF